MSSIYHFFAHLIAHKTLFHSIEKLEDFPFEESLIAARSDGAFPDIILRLAQPHSPFVGGELIELKDSKSYTIASFNSTIPTSQKPIASFLDGKSNKIRDQLESIKEDSHRVPIRDVFYLIRGHHKKTGHIKICLVHGSFFETVTTEYLIQQAFEQVLEERLQTTQLHLREDIKQALLKIFSQQEMFLAKPVM